LSAQLSDRFHIVDKGIFAQRTDHQFLENVAADKIIVINILFPEILVYQVSKSLQVNGRFLKLNKPLMKGFSCTLLDHRRNRKLCNAHVH